MSIRALSLATVLLLIGPGAADTAFAQAQNLEAGKSPSQIFAQTCNACHKSARGLLRTVAPGSLPGFLRQHYTTSSDMAGVLASYLVSNGAADTRYGAGQPKGGREGGKEKEANINATQGTPDRIDRVGRRTRPSQEAAKPEGEGAAPSPEPGGRAGQKRLARPGEEGAAARPAAEGQATYERGPNGRKSRRLSKRGKPETEEAPKLDDAKESGRETGKETAKETSKETSKEAPASAEPSADDKKGEKSDTAKVEPARDEAKPDSGKSADRPLNEAKPETAKPETSKPETSNADTSKADTSKAEPGNSEAPALRPDPVPPVTPAAPAAARPAEAIVAKPADAATSAGGSPEPTASKPQDTPVRDAAPAAAPPPPAAPSSSGSPMPPISK